MNNTNEKTKWYNKTWLVILSCLLFFPVGIYALYKNSVISNGWRITALILVIMFIVPNYGKILGLLNNGTASIAEEAKRENGEDTESGVAGTGSNEQVIGIGQVLQTNYFAIKVNKANLTRKINTGNEFSDQTAPEGNQYMVINTTYKNIDNESRIIMDGSVWITYNGKKYEFDHTETILAKGYGAVLEQLNPLTTKTTNLVYLIPNEIKGEAWWNPGRASENERIYLGDL